MAQKQGIAEPRGSRVLNELKQKYISSSQLTFELNCHFGMCGVIHLRRLINCGCTSVVKISYTIDLYKKKAVLVGALTMQESVLHFYTRRKLSCLKISQQRRAAAKILSHLDTLMSLDCSVDSLA